MIVRVHIIFGLNILNLVDDCRIQGKINPDSMTPTSRERFNRSIMLLTFACSLINIRDKFFIIGGGRKLEILLDEH